MLRLTRRDALASGLASRAPRAPRTGRGISCSACLPAPSSDTVTRLIAEKMRISLGRPVVVENKPGAAGIVANLAVKAAAPDGTRF